MTSIGAPQCRHTKVGLAVVLLRLRYEAECLTSQRTKQNQVGQPTADGDRSCPYRASGLVRWPIRDARCRGRPPAVGRDPLPTEATGGLMDSYQYA
jgi:hypothetical protein